MKMLRKLLLSVILLASPLLVQAAGWEYNLSLPVNGANLTETAVAISSTSNFSAVLATATATRLAWEVQVTSCPAASGRVWYAFDLNGVSTTTAQGLSSSVMDVHQNSLQVGSDFRYIKQFGGLVHQGAIYMRSDAIAGGTNLCAAQVKEWTTTSPLFQ